MYNKTMKLVIQIPCYNEQECILEVLKNIPKKIKGIDEIKTIVIDDGSTDKTSDIASEFGVDKIIKFKKNRGLSCAFRTGINEALKLNADILVNIDGDNQYKGAEIEKLLEPVLNNECDISIGTRPICSIKTFSFVKKLLQKLGSKTVKILSGMEVEDAASGFRAFNKNALLKLNIFNPFTYTVESIIQAKNKNLLIKNVKISTNPQPKRKSKLFKSDFDYVFKQTKNIVRFFLIYRPCRFFSIIASLFFFSGIFIAFRFLYFFILNQGQGHIQSLILCSILMGLSFMCFICAILGDLLSINRKLLEDIQFELRQKKYKK